MFICNGYVFLQEVHIENLDMAPFDSLVHVDKRLWTMIIAIVLVSKPRLSIVVGTSTSRDFAIDDDLQEEAKV